MNNSKQAQTNGNVIVQQIIMPEKKDFMSKGKLAEELDVSVDTIEKWMRDGTLKYDLHYFQKEKVIRFNYPAIRLLLVPRDIQE